MLQHTALIRSHLRSFTAFYYEDFRVGWQEGIDISKEMGLYRQSYCGCVFSEEERYSRALRKLQRKENKEKKRLRLMA